MESATDTNRPTILEKAWTHHAELDTYADRLTRRHLQLRKWVAILGVIATILAILTDVYSAQLPIAAQAILKITLILTPLIGSMIAAYTSRELGDGRWLAMRAGAEEIKKDVYTYRTVLSHYPERNKWLSNRLANIQRQVYKASGDKLDTEPYKGTIPLYFSSDNPNSDPGFNDLTPDDYMRYRLQEQLTWHEGRIVRLSKGKRSLTIAILLMGVAGAFLAALGGSFAVWVALTASMTAALTGWEELRGRDKTIANYSKVKLEMSIIRDFWYGLTAEEKTDSAFYKMVLATETLLFAQNAEWVRSMQETLAGAEDEEKKLVEEMIAMSTAANAELQQRLLTESQIVFAQTTEQLSAVAADAAATVSDMVTAVSDEAMALNQSMEDAVDTAVAQSAAVRQSIDESVDAAAAEAEASRLEMEASRDAVLDEAAAWRQTAIDSADTVLAESAAVRDTAATTIANETEAWSAATQEAVDQAAAQSAAARTAAAAEIDDWSESAEGAVDTAVAESAAFRQTVDESVDMVAAEAEATRLAMEASRDTALAEAAAVREAAAEAVAAETKAWGDTTQETVDTAAARSAAARVAAAAEVDAWDEAAQEAVDTAVAESAAFRQSMDESVDAVAAEAEAARLAMEASRDAALDEAAAVREAAAAAVAAETDAWSDSAQKSLDTAVAESAAFRQSMDESVHAVAAEAEAARLAMEASRDAALDEAAAVRAAAAAAVAAETEAWGEMAQEAVDTAVAESAALRAQASEQVKFAVTFTPVAENILEEGGTAVQNKWEEVVYTAAPDVKYPVQFIPIGTDGPASDEPASPGDEAVDAAVDRLMESGVQVADETIKQALAKAAEDESQ